MKKTLRILVVEDSEDDALLVLHQIKTGGYDIDSERVDTAPEMYAALQNKQWDIVLSDYRMPHFNGLEALTILKESGIDIPFIVISGTIGEEVAVQAMKAGAHDYIMKDNLKRLLPAIERELRESESRADRKLLEQKQKQAEEKLRILSQAVEQSPTSILITDTEGKITYINSKFSVLTGYSPEETLGQNPRFLKSGEMPTEYYKEMWMTINSGKEWSGEFHNRKKSGELYWEQAFISPIFDSTGMITHFLSIKEDITGRKQTEKELISAKEKAEESNRLKTEFLHNMSHEIRTPMNGIMGFTTLLEDPDISHEKQKQYIKFITNSSTQLLRIIDDILEISQLETTQVKAHNEQVCLNDLLLELFSIFDMKAKAKKIPLYLNKGLSDKQSLIYTDTLKLNKILGNLLENALKFTSTGFVEMGYQLKNNTIEIYVQDTGIGINPQKQESIFERFSQEEKEVTKIYGGLGLGLSIAKENTELLGGKITLKSEKGKGSVFYVTIPYNPVYSDESDKVADVDTEPQSGQEELYTILIAEDEEVNYLYLEALLELTNLNTKLIHARNGKEAIEICQKNEEINLVLMDIKMPVMNGYEATKEIKKYRPDLPVIAQTAYSTTEDKELAKSAGCDDFISKPIRSETLNRIVTRYLGLLKE